MEKLGNMFNPQHLKQKLDGRVFSTTIPYIYSDKLLRVYFATRQKDIKNNYVSRSGYVDLNRNNLNKIINTDRKYYLNWATEFI